MSSEAPGGLRSALEIALEKHGRHEDLSHLMAEIQEHVRLLEESWSAIQAPDRTESTAPPAQPQKRAA